MNSLLIGDCHIRPQDLEEGKRLIQHCGILAANYNTDNIILLGDQTHYHDLNHNSVSKFWEEALLYLGKIKTVIALVGNHDLENGRTAHSMQHFKDLPNITIVENFLIMEDFLFVANTTNENFLKICRENSSQTIAIVHQDFNGCQYENGWYASNGVNPEDVPQKLIVSGHIHLHQKFSKIFYTGSPRWLTASDENVAKFVWITDFKDKWIPFTTKNWVSSIHHFEEYEGEEKAYYNGLGIYPKVTIDLHGSLEFIRKRKSYWEAKGFKVKTFPPKKFEVKVKESEGLDKSFNKFLDGFNPPNGTSKLRLKELIKERINW